jgi:uncharacterized protein YndB with AHSA1/START domain
MRTRTFTIYIAAGPEQVWRAITEPAYTRRFYFGLEVDAEWAVGGRIAYRVPAGPDWAGLHGHLVLFDRHRTLMHGVDDTSWVTWEVAPVEPGVCRVALIYDTLDASDAEEVDDAWSRMLSDLKTVLENGRALTH